MKSVGILVQFKKLIRATIEKPPNIASFNKNTDNIIFWSSLAVSNT